MIRQLKILLHSMPMEKIPLVRPIWYRVCRPCLLRMYPEAIFALMQGEEQFDKLFCDHIRQGDVVVDIGANIGYYTILAAKLVGKVGKVFAFEPDPANYALLTENVKALGCSNVVLEEKAVASDTGKLRLYLSEVRKADHRIYDTHNGRRFIEVEGVKLDDYFEGYAGSRIDVIKIDVQGAEMEVLRGMSRLLQRNTSVKLFTEFWPNGLKMAGVEPAEYLVFLSDHGFVLYEINERAKRTEPVQIDDLLSRYSPENQDAYTNLFCVRRN